MDKYRAEGIARRSGFAGKGSFGPTIVESHEWRRRNDIGKRRTTFGVYGTRSQIHKAFSKCRPGPSEFTWIKFRNGKFMVW